MSESSSWQTLRKYLIRDLKGCDIQRIEDKLATGVPDANVCWEGQEFWLEGKHLRELPARSNTRVRPNLSAEQCSWLVTRRAAGGLTFVWLRVNNFGWWLFSNPRDQARLHGGKDDLPHYTKEELCALTYHKTAAGLVLELKEHLNARK